MKNDSLVYGVHAVFNLIDADNAEKIICLAKAKYNGQIQKIIAIAEKKKIEIEYINDLKEYQFQIGKDTVHQNIFAISSESKVNLLSEKDIPNLLKNTNGKPFILILDGIQDPHNLGACIRTANSAGVDFIVIPKDKSASVNATVKKVACGAVEYSKIVVATNISRVINTLKENGIWVIGLDGESDQSIYKMDMQDSIALVAGSEGKGLRFGTKKNCDFIANIPMHGNVSSLNVSVATAVSLYEAVRQRGNI